MTSFGVVLFPSHDHRGGTALCPFHDDKEPSFSIYDDDTRWKCFSCDIGGDVIDLMARFNNTTPKEVIQAFINKSNNNTERQIGINTGKSSAKVEKDGSQYRSDKKTAGNGLKAATLTQQKPVKTYDYTDVNGDLLYQQCRFEPKTFRPRRRDNAGNWVWNLNGVVRVLYNLSRVVEESVIVLVEGEKDADAVSATGFCGTTNLNGANSWLDSYSEYLKGKDLIIVPDQDKPGPIVTGKQAQ